MNKKVLAILHIICGVLGIILYIYSVETSAPSEFRISAFFLMILGFTLGITGLISYKKENKK